MDKIAIQNALSKTEAYAHAMLEQCSKTRQLLAKEEVSTPSAEQQGPLSQQELAAISARRVSRLAKSKGK
jgi:hypothetical protein